MIKATGAAKLTSDVTGKTYEITPEELEWEVAGGDERGMGVETLYEAMVQVEEHDPDKVVSCTWTASEYPVGALNHVTAVEENGALDADFSFHWEYQPED
ncbi:hypothetical protein A6D6_01862 [Alcanivorax xiamenensis]|uniref:Uncharacterized protein n=1 Tax=Alcanivorax xiamenensis TaxID=1177156 RepID=A0ABQ6Y957_9GAMM|nr:hypothetical protein [Alcanivorax xiamenensis]KAF0806044.1 hypothetical protein A6D6_01862 [Alcanivorax xiamenensis]